MKKFLIFLSVVFTAAVSFAQIKVTVNGQKITANSKIKYSDLQSLSVSFANIEKLPNGTDGNAEIMIRLYDEKNEKKGRFGYSKMGSTPVSMFLYAKVAKEYPVFPEPASPVFANYGVDRTNFSTRLQELSLNPKAVIKVQVSVEFMEVLKRANNGEVVSWAEAVDVTEPFVFYIDMVNSSGQVIIPVLNAKLSLAKMEGSGYKTAADNYYLVYWGRDFRNIDNSKPKTVRFEFDKFKMILALCEVTGSYNQGTMYEGIKNGFEKYIRGCSNYCYDKLNEKYWDNKVYPSTGWEVFMGFNKNICADNFDEEINKSNATRPVWQSIKTGVLDGLKFGYMLKEGTCPAAKKSLFGKVTGQTSVPARTVTGYSIVYLFKHPVNPSLVLAFSIQSTESKNADDAMINAMMQKAEQLLGAISF